MNINLNFNGTAVRLMQRGPTEANPSVVEKSGKFIRICVEKKNGRFTNRVMGDGHLLKIPGTSTTE